MKWRDQKAGTNKAYFYINELNVSCLRMRILICRILSFSLRLNHLIMNTLIRSSPQRPKTSNNKQEEDGNLNQLIVETIWPINHIFKKHLSNNSTAIIMVTVEKIKVKINQSNNLPMKPIWSIASKMFIILKIGLIKEIPIRI